ISNNIFASTDDLLRLLDDPFNTTKFYAPLYSQGEGKIEVYTTSNFIVKAVLLDYLKNPDPISIGNEPADNTSILPESYHDQIVRIAVEMYAGKTPENPTN